MTLQLQATEADRFDLYSPELGTNSYPIDIELSGRAGVTMGATNCDRRKYENPDMFDIHRNTKGHLGFPRALTTKHNG